MRYRKLNLDRVKLTEYKTAADFKKIKNIHNGYHSMQEGGLPLDMYSVRAESDTLVVVFHAALTAAIRWPLFAGRGVLRGTTVNRLHIADASLNASDQHSLAWYAGNHRQPNLQKMIHDAVSTAADAHGVSHVIFFGSSGGGFAALQASLHFPCSLAVAINPQTSIGKYLPKTVERYLRINWPGHESLEDLPIEHDLTKAYAGGYSNTVAYVQNERDVYHINGHQRPFYQALKPRDGVYELTGGWGKDLSKGHVPPPGPLIASILRTAAAASGDWPAALSSLGFVNDPRVPTKQVRAKVEDSVF